ncbi:hypothetical protein [Agromyces cerinus]|uniref:Uncharacterized protein n=1 Tax=Agromyces cerinus subsp. cerinus TaxID=232089 RepID=A0A1N6DDF4_9MICO|nr:hypothetical protein [Agromyces cerinus]SIN68802.1 hypothetical protein SAMN05443544_0056 [Agromyces cerinus subsp. cerinus]
MNRTSLRRPEGPAEIVADALRVLGVLSIVVAGVGWGPLSGLSFVAASAAMLVPRLLRVRPAFDLLFGTAVLVSTWSSVLGLFHTTRWWDIPMHFFTNGVVAAMLYVVLVRLRLIADAETLPHPVRSAALMVTVLGLSLGVLWEFFEWFGRTYLDPDILTGYSDTLEDLLQGGLGSLVAGLSMRFLAGHPGRVATRLPSRGAGRPG